MLTRSQDHLITKATGMIICYLLLGATKSDGTNNAYIPSPASGFSNEEIVLASAMRTQMFRSRRVHRTAIVSTIRWTHKNVRSSDNNSGANAGGHQFQKGGIRSLGC